MRRCALGLALILAAACGRTAKLGESCRAPVSPPCDKGLVCIHFFEQGVNYDVCVIPCTSREDCPGQRTCFCPSSCRTDDGQSTRYCAY
jgi:hypothetical protein